MRRFSIAFLLSFIAFSILSNSYAQMPGFLRLLLKK